MSIYKGLIQSQFINSEMRIYVFECDGGLFERHNLLLGDPTCLFYDNKLVRNRVTLFARYFLFPV